MSISVMQISATIGMVGVAVALFYAYRKYLAANSERRMRAMIEYAGLDPSIAWSGDVGDVMKDVRKRCKRCASEDVCDRWLQGDQKRENDFCPNAKVFALLSQYEGAPK